MLVVTPMSGVVYQLFDPHAIVTLYEGQTYIDNHGKVQPGWFYTNYWQLFYTISPQIQMIATLTGVFLLFNKESTRRYFAVIPISYHVAHLTWLLQVNSNEGFHHIVSGSFLLVGLLIAVLWLFTFDFLMDMHFHKREGYIARLMGLMMAPGISAEEKERIAREQIIELRKLYQQQ